MGGNSTDCGKQCRTSIKLFVISAVISIVSVCAAIVFIKLHCDDEYVSDKHWGGACAQGPCQNGGTCSISGHTYICTCTDQFMGRNCEDRNLCFENGCQNGGNCSVSGETMMCICPKGYSGINCEIEKNPCDSRPCQNGGVCSHVGTGYQCACTAGFIGLSCETDDPCTPEPCNHGGSCSVTAGNLHCECPPSHFGKICEKELVEETECQKAVADLHVQGKLLISSLTITCISFIILFVVTVFMLVRRYRKGI